jgi:high-affinity iron transporter
VLVSNGLIGLREGLEAALVVTILVAFLVRTNRRGALKFVWGGVVAAVALSVAAGAMLAYAYASMSFEQQEAFGGFASIVAVAFVTGMVFWMRRAARAISQQLRGRLDDALRVGPVAVAVVAFLAVAREGLETALIFFSSLQTASGGSAQPLTGLVVGLAAAVVLGYLLYRGAIKINLTRFFTVTGVLLILVAAGILAYGVHDLQEAGLLPGLNTIAFDVSAHITTESWYGALLKGIFNFSPTTTVLEAVVWVIYVAVVLTLFLLPLLRRGTTAPATETRQPAAAR